MDRVSSMRFTPYKAKADRFGYYYWTPQRDEKLLYVMRAYGDQDKAARVIGCPVYQIDRRIRFLAASHPELAS